MTFLLTKFITEDLGLSIQYFRYLKWDEDTGVFVHNFRT